MKTEMNPHFSPNAGLVSHQGHRAWFCIRTHPKHEHIAAAHLKQITGVEAFNPQLRFLRSTRAGRRWIAESLFPNYLFANFVVETALEKVTYTPGVKMVLRFGERMAEIPESVIENMRRDLAELSCKVMTDEPMEGEEVEIVEGAFTGMKATVTRVLPGKQRAQILVEVMGRLVPAELSLGLVLYNRRDAAHFALARVEKASFAGRVGQGNSPRPDETSI